jgi:virulence-associated protein VagC
MVESEEAIIHKEGDSLIVEPIRKGKLLGAADLSGALD